MRPKIYLFGDSITEQSFGNGGWGSSLACHFCRTADVVLRGYSGYNTRWALKVIDRVFEEPEGGGGAPVAVTVFFGANDASLPDRCSGFQNVPVDEYKQNLHSIVSFLKRKWPETCIILITPPPIDEAARLLEPYNRASGLPERTNEAAGVYAKQCLAVASECGLPAIDLWTKMQQLHGWEKSCLNDGLHLTENGNKTVFEEVLEQLKKNGVSLEALPYDLQVFSEIDPNDPLKSFSS